MKKCGSELHRLSQVLAGRSHSLPHYTEEQQARVIALPSAVLMVILTMSVPDPETRLRDVIEGMGFVLEVKQAYLDNALIQGMLEDTESLLYKLHISPLSDREAVLRELRLYIEEASALLGLDTESREFRAFLAYLAEKLAEDVERGLFGNDPTIEQEQMQYLRILQQQFSLPTSKPMENI